MDFEQNSFIIDIDGTILHNNNAINNSVEFIKKLQTKHVNFILATNSIKSKTLQLERLEQAGINITAEQLYSPIDSINIYLQQQDMQSCFCVGSIEDINQIQCKQNDISPEIIILLDFEKNNADYNNIQSIINLSQKNIPIITASRSPYYLNGDMKKIDTGAFVVLIESIIKQEIKVFGKPSTFYFENALSKLNLIHSSNSSVMIGDDFQTDILASKDFGFKTVLVKSGKYQNGHEKLCDPDFIMGDLMGF